MQVAIFLFLLVSGYYSLLFQLRGFFEYMRFYSCAMTITLILRTEVTASGYEIHTSASICTSSKIDANRDAESPFYRWAMSNAEALKPVIASQIDIFVCRNPFPSIINVDIPYNSICRHSPKAKNNSPNLFPIAINNNWCWDREVKPVIRIRLPHYASVKPITLHPLDSVRVLYLNAICMNPHRMRDCVAAIYVPNSVDVVAV